MRALFLAALIFCLAGSHQTVSAESLKPMGIATAPLVGYPACSRYRITGFCYVCVLGVCVPKSWRVKHWIPVAFVEVVRQPLDSVFRPIPLPTVPSTKASSSMTRQEHLFEVRVYKVDDNLRALLTLSVSNCAHCGDSSVRKPIGGGASTFMDVAKTVAGAAGCSIEDIAIDEIMNAVSSTMGAVVPLAYASDVDSEGWRKECRDSFVTKLTGGVIIPACLIDGGAAAVGSVASMFGLEGIPGGPTEALCLGFWGPIYPRQMRVMGVPENTAALVTAFRGLHLAAHEFGSLPVDVTRSYGEFQPAFPSAKSSCITPGCSTLAVDAIFRPRLGDDGRYGFYYWVPVECCQSFGNVEFCIAEMAVVAGMVKAGNATGD